MSRQHAQWTTALEKRGRFIPCLFLLLMGLPSAGQAPIPASTSEAAALVAYYRQHSASGAEDFVLIRDGDRVEYRFGDRERQLWLQGNDGISLIRSIEPAQRSVEYTPGDLRSLNAVPDWTTLSTMCSETTRQRLQVEGPGKWRGHRGVRLRSAKGMPEQHLLWSESLQLPLRWRMAEVQWELVRIELQQPQFSSHHRYPLIDYADLGDNEMDPFARHYIHFGDGRSHTSSAH